jgi:hypothetical protein
MFEHTLPDFRTPCIAVVNEVNSGHSVRVKAEFMCVYVFSNSFPAIGRAIMLTAGTGLTMLM